MTDNSAETELLALAERFPEINPNNYNEDDVIALNNWGCEVFDALRSTAATAATVSRDREAATREQIARIIDPDAFDPTKKAFFSMPTYDRALAKADAILSLTPRGSDPLSPVLVQLVQTRCEQPVLSGNDGSEAKSGWRDIETLPEDGSKFDALCVRHDGSRLPVRFTDVSMRGDGSGFGFIQHTKTGPVWHYLEEEDEVFPAWKIWKWMPQPAAPASLTEGDVA